MGVKILIVLTAPLLFLLNWFFSYVTRPNKRVYTRTLAYVPPIFAILSSVTIWRFLSLDGPITYYLPTGSEHLLIRIDTLGAIMFSMISILSLVIIKFSISYLDGDDRQVIFLGRLQAAVYAVMIMVLAGSIWIFWFSWVLTSFCLNYLLIFYEDRPEAIVAARKKFIVARMSDAFLLVAFMILQFTFETGNIDVIVNQIQATEGLNTTGGALMWSGIFIALAAICKSALLPVHGWLIEVMETPTPVSALLHAGLLNAGPFLILRMSHVIEYSWGAQILLIMFGCLSALLGSVILQTQSSVKNALAYSSIAHMGFSLMTCGLGAYPASMLHLIAHSFYKAHSFLSSGSVVDANQIYRVLPAKAHKDLFKITLSALITPVIFLSILSLFDLHLSIPVIGTGIIVILGTSKLLVSLGDSTFDKLVLLRILTFPLIIVFMFLGLESFMMEIMRDSLPLVIPTNSRSAVSILICILFGIVVLFELLRSRYLRARPSDSLMVHIKNGFYLDEWFNKRIGSWNLSIQAKQKRN